MWDLPMFRSVFGASLILFNSFSFGQAASFDNGQYFFRYSTSSVQKGEDDSEASKDITAFFAGGVGIAFSQKIPMRPEWENDNWVLTSGKLPAGISFDSSTETFSGKPTAVVSNREVELVGYDKSGSEVATASVTFDILQLPIGATFHVDLYAHTGKYSFNQLAVPAGITVDKWTVLDAPPPGVNIIGRNLDGTPTKPGTYRLLIQGLDFLGKPVVAFVGTFTVEDAPVFPLVADKLINTDLQYQPSVRVDFATTKVKRAIGKPRYYVEVEGDNPLPGNLYVTNDVFNPHVTGYIFKNYDQATLRYKAVDSDETVAYSNWFKVGTLGPAPNCGTYTTNPVPMNLDGYVGTAFPPYYIPTTNSAGSRTYALVDGQLPKGLSLDAASGLISGTPQQEETREGIAVRIDVSNSGNVDSTTCGPYTFRINPARFDLSASVSPKDFHVGGAVTGVLKTSGGILPGWSVALDSASALPSGVTFDKNALSFSGTVNVAGTYQPTFTLTNGDGRQVKAATTFIAREQLALGEPALKSVAQFELLDDLASAIVDGDTVVGAAKMTVEGGSLPPGMSFAFDGVKGSISGGTKLSPQSFGPYTFKVTDDEGQIANSAPFYLQVTDRKDLVASQPVSPNFTIKKFSSLKPVTVALPPLGDSLVLSYTLNGPALPEGLTFDKDTGTISGTPSAKITLTNYTITVTDGQKSVTSAPFPVTVGDPAAIPPIILGSITKNVTGQVVSFLTTPAPDLSTVADFMVGDVKDAKFTSITPSVPGLFPELSNGTLSGNPTTPFDGDVSISFEDSAGREGKAVVHLIILPYPSISVGQASYSLSRLADASKIGFNLSPNNGFIGSIQYSLASGSNPLPSGITLTSQGTLSGSTTVNPQTFGGIIVNAKDLSTGIEVQSGSFAIKIDEQTALTLALPQKQVTYRLFDGTFAISSADVFNPAPAPTGSRVQPLKWSIDDDGGSGLSISSSTGQLTGTPGRLGSWPITIRVTDSDTPPSSTTDNVTLKATLQGWVVTEPGGQAIGPLRVGESFTTLSQTPSNYVGNPVYSDLNNTGLSLNPSTGQFSGSFDAPGSPTWKLQVTDNDGRTLQNPAAFSAAIVAPLQFDQSGTPSTVISKQFDSAARVTMQFKPATQSIGKVSYAISDNLPGTLVYKFYPNDDLSAKPVFFHYDAQGNAMELAADALPDDAFVFDTVNLTLTGVPSASGSFGQIFLYASDDHQDNYHSPNDPTRASNNTAVAGPFTINVAAADGLVASNNLSSEVIYQYTRQPTIRSTVLNGAYGKPIKFERKAGTLPTNVTANGSGNILTYQGYSTAIGTQSGIIYQATDAVGRSIDVPAVSIETKAREPLVLEASSNPKGMVVFEDDANLIISAKNVPYGGSIASDKWTLTGLSNLPAGVTSQIENGHVSFSGTASVIGTYKDIIVSAVDSLGGSASVSLTFKVISSSDPIEVNVSNITTKVGMPVKMEPPFAAAPISTGNTYGTIRFSSADIATLFPGVTLDSSTGALSGSISSVQENTFNLKVNDGTNRLTSKSVKISVIPNLRIVAPTLITTTQGADANVAVDTSFNIGTVSYVGKGTWPAGLSVNPATGAIKGSAAASTGTYPGLTIEGVDASGDRQSSNVFSIKVDPIDALPIIANVPLNKWPFGTVEIPIQNFTSTVTDNVKGKAWPGPLTFTLNHDIADAGLTFDSKLGVISGTATKPFLYKDLIVTVRTERGDTVSTAPFWFGVQPKDAIVIAAGQKSHYTVRVGSGYSTDPLIFLNTYGNVTFTNVQALVKPINPTNGVYAEATVMASSMSGQPQGGWPEDAVVTDEFGRTGTFRTSLEVAPAVTLTPPATVSFEIAAPSKTSDKPVVAGVVGTPTWSTQGMPSWLTFNADGSFTGSAPTGTPVGDVSFSVTVTDPSDGASKTATYTAKVYTIKSYRVVLDAWVAHPTIATCVGMSEFYVMNGTSDITSLSGVVPSSSDKDYPAKNLTDGVVSTASMWFLTDGSAAKWIKFNRIANNKATAVKWITRADNFLPCNPTQWHIQMSPDDVNWTTIGTGSSTGAVGTYTTQIPQ
jgi:hypothetical protein